MADFTCDSNEALELSLVRAEEDLDELADEEIENLTFHPTFTYPIFGEQEKIYGYKALDIKLHFASGSLAQFFSMSYASKVASSTADDVEGTIYKFIPSDFTKNEETFKKRVEEDAKSFKPLGEKLRSYTRSLSGDDASETTTFEVYHTTWATPGWRDYHRRMQIFVLLYIEAGSYIEEDEDRWEFVTLYQKRLRKDGTEVYHFVGYTTLYPFWHYPDFIRLRLSQFVILPPYRRQSHGSELYRTVYEHIVSRPDVVELTVEDPAEAFEDLRDKNDLLMLITHEQFQAEAWGKEGEGGGKIGPPSDKPWVEKWRKDLKMAGRQFHRLIEMLIQRSLVPGDKDVLTKYRLQVKERLYKFNYEILMQLEKDERLEKLEETFQTVKADYDRLLALVA